MMEQEERDYIIIKDEEGKEIDYTIEALFDMDESSYALLKNLDETILMRIETEGEEQFLVGINDPNERDSILDAYQIAVNASPADQ
jgi:uncharacterized protein YrzB (UPF0473 family)